MNQWDTRKYPTQDRDLPHENAAPSGNGSGVYSRKSASNNYHNRRDVETPHRRDLIGELLAPSLNPDDLKNHKIHVAWFNEPFPGKPGKFAKVPWSPRTGRKASGPHTGWGSNRQRAEDLYIQLLPRHPHGGGQGVVLGPIPGMDGLCLGGIDLDRCRDPKTGRIQRWARRILKRFRYTYSEISPSQTGLKVYFLHWTPTRKREVFKLDTGEDHPPAIEVDFARRYFTFTRQEVPDVLGDKRNIATVDPAAGAVRATLSTGLSYATGATTASATLEWDGIRSEGLESAAVKFSLLHAF